MREELRRQVDDGVRYECEYVHESDTKKEAPEQPGEGLPEGR